MTDEPNNQKTEASDGAKQFIYVEPMGHGLHFVAEVAPSTIVPGSVQLNVLRGDGSIDRTIGMTGAAIFRWTSVSREMALIMAAKLDQERNVWNVTPPERLLIEAARAQTVPPPAESEGDPREIGNEDGDEDEDEDDEDDLVERSALQKQINDDANAACQTARAWLSLNPLYLDTETTGLDYDSEIASIAVLGHDGTVLFESLVKPTGPFSPEATAVNGLTADLVKDAPRFDVVWDRLAPILKGHDVIIYNERFDVRMIGQSLKACEDRDSDWWVSWAAGWQTHCAMELYARSYGDWNAYRQSYTWQSLKNAARQCGIPLPQDLHHAAADAALCRQVVLHMANLPPEG